jgi:MORN repeat protein
MKNSAVQCHYYRSGQLREKVPLRKGRMHGTVRTWHKNGLLASEEPYRAGLLHGVCRQWNEAGKLLGKYRMVHGTGIQRAWHDNGRLQLEISTVHGEFSGRNRIWLRDGTLLSERFYLNGRAVSADMYREAAANDKALPKFRGKPAKVPPNDHATERRIHRLFVGSVLHKRDRSEARRWLQTQNGDQTGRSLGRFKPARDAARSETGRFVNELYSAGATAVIVPDIYRDKAGKQYADSLVVRLPRNAAKRKAIRKVCAQLGKRNLGAVEPGKDIGENHLYLSLA